MALETLEVSPARRRVAIAARVAAAAIIVVASSGKLPHLVVTQAVISALLSMVIPPLWLLDPGDGRWVRRIRRITPFVGVLLISVGTIALQAPAVVGYISYGGPVTAVALVAMLVGSIAFWTMMMPPDPPIRGVAAAGYVLIGGVPISLPAMMLILMPRDIYAAFHTAASSPIDGHTDQLLAGFLLFAAVKLAIFGVATILFVQASREVPEGEEDGDDNGARQPLPVVPGWLNELSRGPLPSEPGPMPGLSVKEPAAPEKEPALV